MGGKKNKKSGSSNHHHKDVKSSASSSSNASTLNDVPSLNHEIPSPVTTSVGFDTSSAAPVVSAVVHTAESIHTPDADHPNPEHQSSPLAPAPEPKVDISPQSDLTNIAAKIISTHQDQEKTAQSDQHPTTTHELSATVQDAHDKLSSAAPRRASMFKRKFSERTQLAFLRDEDIKSNWLFRIFNWLSLAYLYLFHGFYFIGLENLPTDDRGCLFIMRHSTHNSDIYPLLFAFTEQTGKVPRGLVHRLVMKYIPFLRYLGSVPGERHTAEALLQSGFTCCVIPGGADEALIGHENCYVVHWPEKRKGFAKVAKDSNAHIIPFVLTNVEEMRFNPFFWVWNKLRLAQVYNFIMSFNFPFLRFVVYQVSICVWFCASFVQIPIPAQLVGVIGAEVKYDPHHDSIDHIVKNAQHSLQQLVSEAHQQRKGRSFRHALLMRWNYLKHDQIPRWIDLAISKAEHLLQESTQLWNTYSPFAKKND